MNIDNIEQEPIYLCKYPQYTIIISNIVWVSD